MNCYFHSNQHAVAQCVDCCKGLCQQCASKYSIPICDDCNKKRRINERISYIKPLVVCLILYIIGYHLEIMGPDRAFDAYMLMCAYAGWKFINRFCPSVFMWFSLRAMFMYYLFKLGISMFIGFFATPFYIAYCVYKLVRTFVP